MTITDFLDRFNQHGNDLTDSEMEQGMECVRRAVAELAGLRRIAGDMEEAALQYADGCIAHARNDAGELWRNAVAALAATPDYGAQLRREGWRQGMERAAESCRTLYANFSARGYGREAGGAASCAGKEQPGA
jgi:hypothetical protein